MGSNVDLNKLKEEISERKIKRNQINENNGSGNGDVFLSELLQSLKSGTPNTSTQKIRMVEEKAAEKKGEKRTSSGSETMSEALQKHGGGTQSTSQTPPQSDPYADYNKQESAKEKELYEEFERKRKELLGPNAGAYPSNPHQKPQTQSKPRQTQPHGNISEQYINEAIQKQINENFGHILEESLRDTIVEMFIEEKIMNVLNENEDMIKKMVYRTIKELQNKNKKKVQS